MGKLNDSQLMWLEAIGLDANVIERLATPRSAASLLQTARSSAAPIAGDGRSAGGGEPPEGDTPKPPSGSEGVESKAGGDSSGKAGGAGGAGGGASGGGAGAGSGGGGDGGGGNLTDKERAEQLKRWEKEGRLTGSSKELQNQLKDDRDKTLRNLARKRYDEIEKGIRQAGDEAKRTGGASRPVDAGPASRKTPTPNPESTPVVTPEPYTPPRGGDKKPLGELLRKAGLGEGDAAKVGNWLKERHRKASEGKEVPLDSRKKPPKGHDHNYTDGEIEDLIKEYEAEHAKKLERLDKKGKGGSGSGGGGASGGHDGGGAGGHGGGATEGGHGGTGHAPKTDSSKVDTSKAEAFARKAKALLGESKAPKLDLEKVQKQSVALEAEGEALARELQASPELKGFSGSRAKEFFKGVRAKYGSVRAGSAGVILLALNIADAYALVQEVRSILDSKTLREGLARTFELGKNVAKGQIQFAALRFVFRSTPAAIGITVFLGDMDMNLSLGPNGEFDKQIAELVNKVRPGSVDPALHHDNTTNFKDDDAKKLFAQARAEAIKILKDEIGSGLEKYGHDDGLVGAPARTTFEVSKMEKQVLRIDETWFAQRYRAGFSIGKAEMAKTVARARNAGLKDGKEGGEPRFNALLNWAEVQRALNGGTAFGAYKAAYEAGYAEGHGSFETRTIKTFKVSAAGAKKGEKYGQLSLYAEIEYSNGTKGAISEEVRWSADPATVATVAYDKAARITRAKLLQTGKLTIKGTFVSAGKTFEDTLTITIDPPKISIVPAIGTYAVGAQMRFVARTETWPAVPAGSVVWSASPKGIVKIDQDGNAVMLKVGEAEIAVTESEASPVWATSKVKVVSTL